MLKILADFQLDKLFANGFLGQEHVDWKRRFQIEPLAAV